MSPPSADRPAGSKRARGATAHEAHFQSIVGVSARMRRIFKLVTKVAATDSTVLLLGESGTGKELIARSIHLQSKRAAGPFIAVNVAALPESLIESELFGHQRGAFTGAATDRRGLIEEADRGTLFLDEIGDMPLPTQVKLLRVLENSEVRRLGENVPRHVDVRVVAATHHDLQADVAARTFRGDLYHRLNVIQIDLPPLRDRHEDIGLLALYFLERTTTDWARPPMAFSPEAMTLLETYDYPGNVRELENAIEHAVTVAEGQIVTPADLPVVMRASRQLEAHADRGNASAGGASNEEARRGLTARESEDGAWRDAWSLADVEKEHIRRVLERHHGNATAAARQLGISRTTLWRKLREYGLARRLK
jgi:two-component system, NtrC family, response regulator HydG